VSPLKRIGLALSGGAALGGAHIGVLEVLEEHGLRASYVAGTSAGSAVGAAYCAGLSLARIREVASDLHWGTLGRVVLPRQGFFDGSRLEEYLIDLIGDLTFDQMEIPFAAAAADILTDELVVIREGRVAPAVRASCAAPAAFTPVQYEGHLLVDGGLINNLPVSAVREMGAEYVIAVDLYAPLRADRKPPATMLEMLMVSFQTLMRNTHREAELADLIIRPDVGEFSLVDLANIPILIERGRQAAEEALPRILADLYMEGNIAG